MLLGGRSGAALLPVGHRIRRVHVDASTVELDALQLARIVSDLRANGGVFTPTANWLSLDPGPGNGDGAALFESCFTDDAVQTRMSTMDKMLRSWIGFQVKPAAGDSCTRYDPFLRVHDPLRLWSRNVEDPAVLAHLIDTDLGSIMDLNLIYSFASPAAEPARIVEIGGGYGRLAEAALNVFGEGIRYVLTDSVPASLLYARDYLRRVCPDRQIGFYYDGDPFDLEVFNCYILPTWRFDELNRASYDICINIESFQEMAQEQVDGYLAMFDRVASNDALIYISNAHDYAFVGKWRFPPTWRRVFCANTPRSWTRDHPTEIFVKDTVDCSLRNGALLAAYHWSLTHGG